MRRRGRVAARRRASILGLFLAVGLWFAPLAGPAVAQVTTIETVPPEVDDEGRTAGERIDGVVVMLRVLGVVVVVSTGAFWWRTRPGAAVVGTMEETGDEPVEVA